MAGWFGWDETAGVDWLKHGIQIIFAVIAIALVARLMGGRTGGQTRTTY